jgi:predicted RNA-binding protein with PUA-like domain
MAKGHWLVKTEPGSYGWERFAKEGSARWDGVRNPAARKNLGAMKPGDAVLFYHTGDDKEVVGVARVARAAYPDPADAAWLAVDLEPVKPLPRAMSLQDVEVGGRGGADDLTATELRALASPDPLPAALAGFGDGDDNGGAAASLEERAAHGFSVTEADGTAVDSGGGDDAEA